MWALDWVSTRMGDWNAPTFKENMIRSLHIDATEKIAGYVLLLEKMELKAVVRGEAFCMKPIVKIAEKLV